MQNNLIQKVKENLNIVDIIQSYIKIEKAGINYKACCPFHMEKTPSFFISPSRQTFNCFGCGVKGDLISFIKEYEKIDFKDAFKIAFDKSGLPKEEFENNLKRDIKDIQKEKLINDSLELFDIAIKIYKKNIDNKTILYLKNRGLNDKTIDEWCIGTAPELWQYIEENVNYIKKFDKDLFVLNGLIKINENKVYDFFRNRIIFPLFDIQGKPIAISARVFEDGEPKYLNSKETPIFNKSEALYGIHKAKEGIRKFKYALLVEGQIDLLLCHQEGFSNTIATSGTALTDKHLNIIRRYTDKIMLVYDSDKAGINATIKAYNLALTYGFDVKVAVLPKGEDPASTLQKDKKIFLNSIQNALHVVEYIMKQSDLDSRSSQKEAFQKLIPLIASIENVIDREYFINKATQLFNMNIDTFTLEIRKFRNDNSFQNIEKNTKFDQIINQNKYTISNIDKISKTLAEFKVLVYIYKEQLNKSNESNHENDIGQIYIDQFLNTTLYTISKEYIEDFDKIQFSDLLNIDENILYKFENELDKKKLDLNFYKREIQSTFDIIIDKIYQNTLNVITHKLREAEIKKDFDNINKYTEIINKLFIYKNAKK